MTTDLRFLGDWTVWAAVPVALLLAAGAWVLYWRETRSRGGALPWVLPTLRALAVFLLFMMLAGPVLHHRKIVGELARVLIFVDASRSMDVSDEAMDTPRKLLIAGQLGWLPQETFDPALQEAVASLSKAQHHAGLAKAETDEADLKKLTADFAAEISKAVEALKRTPKGAWDGAASVGERLAGDLLKPARDLIDSGDARKLAAELQQLGAAAARREQEARQALQENLGRAAAANPDAFRNAIQKFDALTRWQRAELLLLDGSGSLLPELAAHHEVELAVLAGEKAEVVWWPGFGEIHEALRMPDQLRASPTNHLTDLSTGVGARLEKAAEGERVAVVLISDGQQNAGSSPAHTARVLGNRGIPIFTVGMGPQDPPADLAILGVKGPDTVFHEAQVRGEIQLKDDMPAGKPITLKIEREGRLIWEKQIFTEGRSPRAIPYDFPIKELVQGELRKLDKDLKFSSLPLDFKVTVSTAEGELRADNNAGSLRLSAITDKPKVLLLDGQPRWEFRYLRNLFERDQRWEVNALLAGAGGERKPWTRGRDPGQFPADKESLFGCQLIVIGGVPPDMFRAEEIEWIREFVEKRGGGVIFVDGPKAAMNAWQKTPLDPLLPISWEGQPIGEQPVRLRLTAGGNAQAPMSLVSDAQANAEVWSHLPAPRWVAPSRALPGSETLLEAESAGRSVSALVFRRFGAGRALYAGFDESWRWRYDVGDLYHQKFWNQAAKWIMEPAFPVQDKFVSLDTGAISYAPGDSAEIRVRLRDAQGRLILNARAEAHLIQDGKRVGTVALAPDENAGGIFRGKTGPLAEGTYEVRVRADSLPEGEMKARAEIVVAPQGAGELALLQCNEQLLREMAFHSGGQYFREEDVGMLKERLQPLSQGQIIESETLLWQSWWWFLPIVLLLTVEWILRKRGGML